MLFPYFRKSFTSSRINSLSSAILGQRLEEKEVIIVAYDDVVSVNHIHVLDGEEREGQHTVVQRLACQLVRILNLHQVNIAQFFDRFSDVSVRESNFIHPFETAA